MAKQDNLMSWLTMITIICSEREHLLLRYRLLFNLLLVIFLTRTWAIWERSRPMLIFLIGLFIVR